MREQRNFLILVRLFFEPLKIELHFSTSLRKSFSLSLFSPSPSPHFEKYVLRKCWLYFTLKTCLFPVANLIFLLFGKHGENSLLSLRVRRGARRRYHGHCLRDDRRYPIPPRAAGTCCPCDSLHEQRVRAVRVTWSTCSGCVWAV